MNPTVVDPPYGSVDSYAQILRRIARRRTGIDYLDSCALAIVQVLAGDVSLDDTAKVERIKNVAAAAELVDREPGADPTGQLYTRADDADDPTPVSSARGPLHTGGVTDGGLLVDETEEEPVHAEFSTGESGCGLATVPPGAGSSDWNKVTCQACIDEAPF